METCDISLEKEKTVELIKTEPQNEDDIDIYGQSGIKIEDSNLAGDFKDTKNYEAHSFQTSDVEMKSPWDGFLPIKEEIKDESDTSNSVNEIVKTEIKLYDSPLGIMDSNIDHFTPVDKPEIKLEQDQSTLSREILHSNILAQKSSDLNLNIGYVNINQDLYFNAQPKKAKCTNLLLKRLCYELKEKITSECKTSFLNSDQTKYGKEHQGAFNEDVYKAQACSNNHLMDEGFKDNVEINMLSNNHPKLGRFCVSTEARETKYNLEKDTKKGEHYIAHGLGRICKTENGTKQALKEGCCNSHGEGNICKTKNCIKYALKGGHCFEHGRGMICLIENCTKNALAGGLCNTHGGGRICKTGNCTKRAQLAGHCIAHGGGRKCKTENCIKTTTVGENCIVHGGGRKCKTLNCCKYPLKGGNCFEHGGGRTCKTENCIKMGLVGGHCFAHGGGNTCKTENCTKKTQLGGRCIAHGGGRKCKINNCSKYALKGGNCFAHGSGKTCKT